MATKEPNRWSSADIFRAVTIFFFVLVMLRFFWFARHIVLVSILGILFGITLSKGVDYLERWRIRRGLGAAIVVLAFLGLLGGIGALLAPTLRKQSAQLREKLPTVLDEVEKRTGMSTGEIAGAITGTTASEQNRQSAAEQQRAQSQSAGQQTNTAGGQQPGSESQSPSHGGQPDSRQQQTQKAPQDKPQQHPVQQPPQKPGSQPLSAKQAEQSKLRQQVSRNLGAVGNVLFPFVSGTVAVIGGIIFLLFMAMYLAADPRLYRKGFEHLIPPRSRPRAREVLDELTDVLRQWLLARLLAMVLVGIITGTALALLKVPAAAALGVIAGLLEFIPFVGPIVSAVPAIGMALIVSPTKAFYVVILFLIVQQLEGNLITPLLMKNRLDVPPAVTIFAVSALGILFGILGMLVAEPLSAAAIVLARRLYVDRIEKAEVAE